MNINVIRRKKNYFEVTRQQQFKNRKTLIQKLNQVKEYAKSIGLCVESITLRKFEDPEKNTKIIIIQNSDNNSVDEHQMVFKCLMVKDVTNLSCRKYKLLRLYLSLSYLPGINKVRNLQNQINSFFKTKKNNYGSYCNVSQKITFVCKKYLEQALIIENDKIVIKLSDDGTHIT